MHEKDVTRTGTIAAALVGAVVLVVAILFALHEGFDFAVEAEIQNKVLGRESPELAALHASELQRLEHYQWIDKDKGIVRIPVERALELVVAQGSGPYPPTTPAPATPPTAPTNDATAQQPAPPATPASPSGGPQR